MLESYWICLLATTTTQCVIEHILQLHIFYHKIAKLTAQDNIDNKRLETNIEIHRIEHTHTHTLPKLVKFAQNAPFFLKFIGPGIEDG